MPREKLPNHLAGIHIFRGFPDDHLWQVLQPAGPGVATFNDCVVSHFRSLRARFINGHIN
jgi:hypothetical protein